MVQVIVLPKDGGYKPTPALPFEPYAVMVKRLGLPDARNKGPLSLIPEAENAAHKERMAAYRKALIAEIRATQVHTCDGWEFDVDEESPSVWCPACRHAEWRRHSKASQQLIVDAYMAEYYPQPAKPAPERKPLLTVVTPLQKNIIEGGGALGAMMRDSLTGNMRSWFAYAEMDDKEWLNRKVVRPRVVQAGISKEAYMAALEQMHGPVKRREPREEGYVPDQPAAAGAGAGAFFNRVAAPKAASASAPAAAAPMAILTPDEGKRMAAFAAWDAQDRETVRKPYHKGKMVAGHCKRPSRAVSDSHKVVLRNLPLEVESLKADMWELVAQVAPVTFLEAPKGIFITLATPADVDKVLAQWPNGVQYMGRTITFERAGRK